MTYASATALYFELDIRVNNSRRKLDKKMADTLRDELPRQSNDSSRRILAVVTNRGFGKSSYAKTSKDSSLPYLSSKMHIGPWRSKLKNDAMVGFDTLR